MPKVSAGSDHSPSHPSLKTNAPSLKRYQVRPSLLALQPALTTDLRPSRPAISAESASW